MADKDEKIITTTYITKGIYQKLKVYAARKLMSMSEIMEQALIAFFEK